MDKSKKPWRNKNWNGQVSKVCNEIYGTLSMLRQTQDFLPKDIKQHLIKSLVIPKFMYCSEIFMGCSRANWHTINVCFNSCIRYIHSLKKFDSVSKHVNELLGCSLENYMNYRVCLFIFNLMKKKTPHYLYEKLFFPRFRRSRMLSLPPTKSSKQHINSFFVRGPRLWNSLPSDLRIIDSLAIFKRECLSHFASQKAQK
ncbi:CLUMA_CG002697, isoform A [Clunio marinus]|uniref:CLUMA_CG002697, isoform A n=1 Tax=Clunio marinus TaxID=568069 RepID=A0A1J1HRG7_9DIPT|nr:CLUMA_CG002697, isoform A [Clunio marinus]